MESETILKILNQHYPLEMSRIELHRSGGSKTYIVEDQAHKYILKVISQAFADTAKQSASILDFLIKHECNVPAILKTKEQKPYYVHESNIFMVFEFIEGREVKLGEDIELIGTLTAKMHNIMSSYPGELIHRDKAYYIDRYIDLLERKQYPKEKIDHYKVLGNQLWHKVKDLPRGFCHGDLYRGNVFKSDSGHIYFLDFDTSCIGFPIYDIMIMCDSTDYFNLNVPDYKKTIEIYDRFLQGYMTYKRLSKLEIDAFYDLVAIRHFQLQATILEIHGIDCVDFQFIDNQYHWLMEWLSYTSK